MPKLPEKYNPGELDRTRQNLGHLTEAEKKAMAAKLGGEVGVERTAQHVEAGYQNLKDKAWEKKNTLIQEPSLGSLSNSHGSYKGTRDSAPRLMGPKMKWWHRVKLDFYCASGEARVKTLSQALASLFSISGPAADLVSRHYVLDLDHEFAKGIENLVLSIRGLTSKNNRNALQALRTVPVFTEILKVLREWDIEGLNRELTRLQKNPGHRTFEDFRPLMKLILRPFYLLSRLQMNSQILAALQKIFELDRSFSTSQTEREKFQKFYLVAREELPEVFGNLRRKTYPFLVKLLAPRFIPRESFFTEMEPLIWEFLEITEKDLIKEIPTAAHKPFKPQENPEESPEPQDSEEPKEKEDDPLTPPPLAQEALEILDQMFPRSGWKNLVTSPDLFTYFHALLPYPKGSEYLPPADPLHPLQTLSLIVQNLFYGLHSIQFGSTLNQFGEAHPLGPLVEKAVSNWHFFMEEFFTKNYLPQLTDLIRWAERTTVEAEDPRKILHQLHWYRRNWILPHARIPVLEGVRIKKLGHPEFSQQITHWMELLAPVVVDLETAYRAAARGETVTTPEVENPGGLLKVSVANPVIQRLVLVLQRRAPGGATHRNLLYTLFSFMTLMDHLVNQPQSLLNLREVGLPYRTLETGSQTPLLSVPKKNTLVFLKTLTAREKEEAPQAPPEDRRESLLGPFTAQEELKKQVQKFHRHQAPFAAAVFKHLALDGLPRSDAQVQLEALKELILTQKTLEQTLTPLENQTLLLVLPGLDASDAADLTRRVLQVAAQRKPHPLPLAALAIPFQRQWTLEKFLSLPTRGFLLGQDYPAQILGIYNPDTQSFDFQDDLPVVRWGLAELSDQAPLLPEDEEIFKEHL